MFRSRILRRLLAPAALLSLRCLKPNPIRYQPAFHVTAIRMYSDDHPPHGKTAETPRAAQYLLEKSDVIARVIEVVKNFEKVDASKVTNESHFINDLGLDSLDVVEVVMALEQEFILDIPDHDAEKIQSIPDAVEYIAQNPMAK